jgi:hypothetical protein
MNFEGLNKSRKLKAFVERLTRTEKEAEILRQRDHPANETSGFQSNGM